MKFSNFLLFIMTLIFSATHAFASDLVLTEKDFSTAQKSEQFIIFAQLNESGKRKIKNLDGEKELKIKVAGEEMNLKVKADIKDKIQFGPLSKANATKLVNNINNK